MGSVIDTIPPFEAEYAAWPICPSKAATDAVLTITPRSPSASGGASAMAAADRRRTLNVPIRFTWITFRNRLKECGPVFPRTRSADPIPAQLTAPLRLPNELSAVLTAFCTLDSSVTSV